MLNLKNSGVNSFKVERWRRWCRLTGKISALTALNRNKTGANSVERTKSGVNGDFLSV